MKVVLRTFKEGEVIEEVIEDFFDIQFRAGNERFRYVAVKLAENDVESRPEINIHSAESLAMRPVSGNSVICGYQRFLA